MNLVLNNPYRTVGLLVGAKAAEQTRQINRLKMYLEAEQEPQEDFSFPALGNIHRTAEKVSEAASKLNLDCDKMNAALFWFYKGNPITDEPAFDALKDGNIDDAISIWTKLTKDKEVDNRNASAFQNLSTLVLNFSFAERKEELLEIGILRKLKFLESDFVKDFKAIATDETFKTTKRDIQLTFLTSVQAELEKHGGITTEKFIRIINKLTFTAKDDFLKVYVQTPIGQIERKIEEAKTKRKTNKSGATIAGKVLFEQTSANLVLLKSILGTSNIKYASVSDKVSDEILQCGIEYFLFYRDSDTDPGSNSMELFRKAKAMAIGNIAKQRCDENTMNLQEWIDEKPERDKIKKIKNELDFIHSKLERFQTLTDTVDNSKDLVISCKPKIQQIKSVIGKYDDLYLNLSSAIVQNAQNMLVLAVNVVVENSNYVSNTALLKIIIKVALDTTFNIGTFDMHSDLRTHYSKNLEGLKSLASQLGIPTLSPKEQASNAIYFAEKKLSEIQNTQFLQKEFTDAIDDLNSRKQWQFGRSQAERIRQIEEQEWIIQKVKLDAVTVKNETLEKQKNIIAELKRKLNQLEY